MNRDTVLKEVEDQLHKAGYFEFSYKYGRDASSVSGVIMNVDLSNAKKSVPEGENTGPFETIDNEKEVIPEDVLYICEEYEVEVTVMGHGSEPERLHLCIFQ